MITYTYILELCYGMPFNPIIVKLHSKEFFSIEEAKTTGYNDCLSLNNYTNIRWIKSYILKKDKYDITYIPLHKNTNCSLM